MGRRKDAAGVSCVMALRRKSGVLLGLPWPHAVDSAESGLASGKRGGGVLINAESSVFNLSAAQQGLKSTVPGLLRHVGINHR